MINIFMKYVDNNIHEICSVGNLSQQYFFSGLPLYVYNVSINIDLAE